MKAEVKALWLAALRSGKYEQGQHALRVPGEQAGQYAYCCLGVLCDVFQKTTGQGRWVEAGNIAPFRSDNDEFVATAEHDRNDQVLPEGVVEWAGLDQANPDLPSLAGADADCLAAQNDSGATFAEIADMIEADL